MSLSKLILTGLAACAPLAHASSGLVLAPGKSVTLVDVADSGMKVVLTAPADAALDLGPLLAARSKGSILALVTAVQLKQAAGLVMNEDGSISLVPAAAPAATPEETGPDGGVVVFNEGRYVGFSEQRLVAAPGLSDSVNLDAVVAAAATAAARSASSVPSATAINFQQFTVGSGGSMTINGGGQLPLGGITTSGGISTGSGTIQITGPNGTPIGGSISAGTLTTTGTTGGNGVTLK